MDFCVNSPHQVQDELLWDMILVLIVEVQLLLLSVSSPKRELVIDF